MRGKKSTSLNAIAAFFAILLLSSAIAPMTASIPSNPQVKPSIIEEHPLQSDTMTFTSGESISFTSTETMTISKGNTISVSSGVTMTFSSRIKMQFIEVVPDGALKPCDWLIVTAPMGYLPDTCSWWEVVSSTGLPLGEFHVDLVLQPNQFHIDQVFPGNINVPVGAQITAVRKIDVIESCRYYVVHEPAHWYPDICSWWEILDPETGQRTGFEFHVDWTNESCEFHIDLMIPGPYVLPFPWYEITAIKKIPVIAPCTYLTVEEPAHWYPKPCSWWEILDPLGLPTGYEFHVDWTNESCEFHIDDVYPGPYTVPPQGVGAPFVQAREKIANITSCDWFVIDSPPGYMPDSCSWWEILDPLGHPTGLEFHIDIVNPDGTFHVDEVLGGPYPGFILIPWYPPTVTITVAKKTTTITECSWFRVTDLTNIPTPCSWWRVVRPDVGDLEFHVDEAYPDGRFHVDIVIPTTTFPPAYAVAAERKIELIEPCDWFTVKSPQGYLPQPCSWWKVTLPTGSTATFHVDATDGAHRFHVDRASGTIPGPTWEVTAENYQPTLPWYMKPAYPDYTPSGMPDFDQRQGGTYLWMDQAQRWSHCGPVAVANSLWWLDSKFESNTLPPPAVIDNYPLVTTYGPWDDHDPQNFPWLVEQLAYLMDTDGRRTGIIHSGTNVFDMEAGITHYLSIVHVNPLGDVDGDGNVTPTDANIVQAAMGTNPGVPGWDMRADVFPVTLGGGADNVIDPMDLAVVSGNMGQLGWFYEHTELAPTWEYIVEQVMMCQDVELLLVPWYYDPGAGWYRYAEGAHYVTVAGLNASTREIVFSDPIRDNAEAGGPGDVPVPHMHMPPEPPYITHNDARLVSHDMYPVIVDPCPGGPLTLPTYMGGAIPPPGPYPIWRIQIEAAVVTCPYEVAAPDLAVTAIATAKTGCLPKETIGQGKILKLNVTVENQGATLETSNVRIFANNTQVGLQPVTLNPAEVKTLAFTWDTTSYAKGNYWLNATIDQVLGETDTADNTLNYGWTYVSFTGDIDGDRDVDIFDIVRMAGVYGVKLPNPRYDPNADTDSDGDIDIFDIVAAATNYGKKW